MKILLILTKKRKSDRYGDSYLYALRPDEITFNEIQI